MIPGPYDVLAEKRTTVSVTNAPSFVSKDIETKEYVIVKDDMKASFPSLFKLKEYLVHEAIDAVGSDKTAIEEYLRKNEYNDFISADDIKKIIDGDNTTETTEPSDPSVDGSDPIGD